MVFGVVALICAIYCISACYKEYQEEQERKEKKARKKAAMAEQLKIQTSVYLAQKMRTVSTAGTIDMNSLSVKPV